MEGETPPPQVLNDPSVIKINKFSDVCPCKYCTFLYFVSCYSLALMKWNATIIVTFQSALHEVIHELTKIVLQKFFYEVLWCQIEPFRLANWTKKVLPVFPRNMQYRARLKGPPFSFLALWDFFRSFFLEGFPLHFFDAWRQKGCWKIPKGPPFQFFRHCETFKFFFWVL